MVVVTSKFHQSIYETFISYDNFNQSCCFFSLLFRYCWLMRNLLLILKVGVLNEKGEALKSATVFINGSQKITVNNEEGNLNLKSIP